MKTVKRYTQQDLDLLEEAFEGLEDCLGNAFRAGITATIGGLIDLFIVFVVTR